MQSSWFDLNTTFDKIMTCLKWHKRMRTKFSLYFTARIKNNDENCHIFACFVHLTLISTFIFYLSQQFSTHIYCMLLPHKKNILLLQSTQCGFCNNAYLIEELALAILHLFKLVIISLQNTFTIQNEVEYK